MRRFLMCLCIAGALLLASCGGEKSDAPAAIFRAEKITLTEGFAADYDGLSLSDGRVHVTGYDIESNKLTSLTSVILQVFSCAVDGTEADLASLADVGQGTRRTVYTSGGGMVETETYMRTPTAVERVAIRHTDAHGTVREYDCAEVFGLDPAKIKISELDGSGGFFVHAAYDTEAGLMIVSTTGAALVKDGVTVSLLESKEEITGCAMADSGLILIYNKRGEYTACYADPMRAEPGETLPLPAALTLGKRQVELFALDGYTLGLRNEDGVYGLTEAEDGEYMLSEYPYLNRPSWLADEWAQHENLHVIGYPDADGSGILAAPLVTMSAYEKFLERYEDMAYYYHGGKRTLIAEPMNAAEAAKEYGEGRLVRITDTLPLLDTLVMSAVPAPPYADAVKDILWEELSAYEAGTVNADAAIERMEKRVRTYVSERYQ